MYQLLAERYLALIFDKPVKVKINLTSLYYILFSFFIILRRQAIYLTGRLFCNCFHVLALNNMSPDNTLARVLTLHARTALIYNKHLRAERSREIVNNKVDYSGTIGICRFNVDTFSEAVCSD